MKYLVLGFITFLMLTIESRLCSQDSATALHALGDSVPSHSLLTRGAMVADPRLRISDMSTGSEGILFIDLDEIVVAPFRPRIIMRKPIVPGTQSAIVLAPSDGTPSMEFTNTGPLGAHGLRVKYKGDLDRYLEELFDLPTLSTTRIGQEGDENVMLTHEYEKSTPKLIESVSSDNVGIESRFTHTYNLSSLTETRAAGDSTEIMFTREYEKSVPKLSNRVSSGIVGVDHYFSSTYDLASLAETHVMGDSLENVMFGIITDKSTPKLSRHTSSGNAGVNNFFNITQDLAVLAETHVMGDSLENVMFGIITDKSTPKLSRHISSGNAGVVDSFQSSYDLSTLTTTEIIGNSIGNVIISGITDKATPKWTRRFSSDNNNVGNIIEIEYNLNSGSETKKVTNGISDISITKTFDTATPKFHKTISSGNAPVEILLTNSYDLSTEGIPKVYWSGDSDAGLDSMSLVFEYDLNARKIRQRTSDDAPGGMDLTLEHTFTPDPLTGTSTLKLIDGGLRTPTLIVEGAGLSHSIWNTGNVMNDGNMEITGDLMVLGVKAFRINHPLDPDNKYLIHSCVESPDMMNVYNGNITTDADGIAVVHLPEYFEALNKDFRYQLTCIGQFARAMISEKIEKNKFTIRTDLPYIEVSWQVTGIRHDPAALTSWPGVEVPKLQ